MLGLSRQSLYVKLRRYGLGDLPAPTRTSPEPAGGALIDDAQCKHWLTTWSVRCNIAPCPPRRRPAPVVPGAVRGRRAAQADHLVPADVGLRLRRGLLGRAAGRALAADRCWASLLAGPLVCATSQAVNDWFDRHVDAINEPHRPIPSGRMPGRWGLYIAIAWTAAVAAGRAGARALGLRRGGGRPALAWAYSAPPLRLKRNGWWGNAAVRRCATKAWPGSPARR